MMKMKKNQSGMTLVEVVVAIAMFSAMTLGICYAFSGVMKITAKNMKRDKEISAQQTALEKKTTSGVMLNDGTTLDGQTLSFGGTGAFDPASGYGTISGVSEYKAIKSEYVGGDINFELKSLSSIPLGCANTNISKDENRYGFKFTNKSDQRVDVHLVVTSGQIFEGTYGEGYMHAANTYTRTLAPVGESAVYSFTPGDEDGDGNPDGPVVESLPDRFVIGYYNPDIATDDDLEISVVIRVGGNQYTRVVDKSTLAYFGEMDFEISDTGVPDSGTPVLVD